jgi:hypothetical protein
MLRSNWNVETRDWKRVMNKVISHELQASFTKVLTQWLKSRGCRIGLDEVNIDIEKEVKAAKKFGWVAGQVAQVAASVETHP